MIRRITIITLVLLPLTGFSQIETGKYLFCFKEYWACHTQIKLELLEDNQYNFTLQDDVQSETSSGTWKLSDDKLTLTPQSIPDTFEVTLRQLPISKSIKQRYKDDFDIQIGNRSLVALTLDYEPLKNTEITIFPATYQDYNTKELGFFLFKDNAPDSITFRLENRTFAVYPEEQGKGFLYNIWIHSNFRDPAIRMTMNGEIPFDGQLLFMNVWNEDKKESERLIFRRIE